MKASTFLFGKFPRQMSFPYRIQVNSAAEMVKSIQRMNGHAPIFTSLYSLEKDGTFTNRVDKVVFDQDGETAKVATAKLSKTASDQGCRWGVAFSGGGYHLYVLTEPHPLKHPGGAIWHFQQHLMGLAGLTYQQDSDHTSHGDWSRCIRVPGTWNTRRKTHSGYILARDWVLTRESDNKPDLYANPGADDWLTEEGRPVDLRPFDRPKPFESSQNVSLDLPGASAPVFLQYNCTKDFAADPNMNNVKRYVLATHIVEMAHTLEDLDQYMKDHLSPKKYRHAREGEGESFKRIFVGEKPFPGCDWIRRQTNYPEAQCVGCPKYK